MTNLILVALMQVSAVGAERGTFEQAYQRSLTTGRPLVVLIGATWCPGCQTMKNSVMPQVAEAGGLERVVFFYVDFDRQRQLATRLRRATSIPQLIRFDRTATGWKTKCLVGAKSPREVYDFINASLVEEAKITEVSAPAQSQDRFHKPASGGAPASKAAPPPSRTPSSADAAQPRGRDSRSSSSQKPRGFSYYWTVFQQAFSQQRVQR